jgi:hypothetical protein
MRPFHSLIILAGLTFAGLPFLHGQDTDDTSANGVQVMARGPVHEAYAMPQETRPEATPVVPKQPPDPIEETPPDQKPEGDNVQWIPGYWAWDADVSDYVWVSGFWRNVPPGQQWVPGHWDQADDGWRWVPGFWTSAQTDQIEYLSQPPASIDSGPSTPAPNDHSTYVPGCWVWSETRYLWRPGVWIANQPDWCYVPAHYLWTPGGYIFCEGFWDYPLLNRGLLFAPVRFTRRLWENHDWSYVPDYCLQPDFLVGALFNRPGYPNYVFGDFFADNYRRLGYRPWFEHHYGRYALDPSYTYYAHRYGSASWERGIQRLYQGRYSGEVPRPPHNLVQQNQVVHNLTVNKEQNTRVNQSLNLTHIQNAAPLTHLSEVKNVHVTALSGLTARRGVTPPAGRALRVESVPHEVRVQQQRSATALREAATQRRVGEARLVTPSGRRPAAPRALKLDLPRAPTTGTRSIKPPPHPIRPEGTPGKPQVHTPQPRPEVHTPPAHPATPQPQPHVQTPPRNQPAPHVYTPTQKPAPLHQPAPTHVPSPSQPQPHPQPHVQTPPRNQPAPHVYTPTQKPAPLHQPAPTQTRPQPPRTQPHPPPQTQPHAQPGPVHQPAPAHPPAPRPQPQPHAQPAPAHHAQPAPRSQPRPAPPAQQPHVAARAAPQSPPRATPPSVPVARPAPQPVAQPAPRQTRPAPPPQQPHVAARPSARPAPQPAAHPAPKHH